MAQKIEPAPTTLSGEPRPRYRDDLEAQIDEFIQGIIDLFRFHLRGLILIALLVAGFFLWLWPTRATWGPVALMVGFALLQIAFAIVFVIIQFGAIFWFLGRGRTYWIKPGETGVGFADYKGNPEVLESARRVVTLLRGVKEFKEMGGEVRSFHMTMGDHDFVVMAEAPDDAVCARFVLTLGAMGFVRT